MKDLTTLCGLRFHVSEAVPKGTILIVTDEVLMRRVEKHFRGEPITPEQDKEDAFKCMKIVLTQPHANEHQEQSQPNET